MNSLLHPPISQRFLQPEGARKRAERGPNNRSPPTAEPAAEWLKGKSVDDALKIDNMEIVEELNLPPVKIHCSVLAEDAIKAAINDYRKKQGLEQLVFEERIH